MKSKQEILDHLSKTVYTHNARKSIIQWMLQHHVVDYKCQIKFAKHVYNRDGVKMTEGLSFSDFAEFARINDPYREIAPLSLGKSVMSVTETSATKLADAWTKCVENIKKSWCIACNEIITEDFQIGDWVKYIPEPGEESTECIEAIAHDTDGKIYLCLSNGEYVRPYHCIKYKAQGEERRKLIDKLNEVI